MSRLYFLFFIVEMDEFLVCFFNFFGAGRSMDCILGVFVLAGRRERISGIDNGA